MTKNLMLPSETILKQRINCILAVMKHGLQNIKNWKIAILFSAIFSLFGVITNSRFQSDFNLFSLLPTWLLTFSFLWAAWHLNSRITNHFFLTNKKRIFIYTILFIILLNIILLIFFILLGVFISKTINFDRGYNYLFLTIRGIASISIIYLVQFTLNLNERNQTVLLQNEMLKTENIRTKFDMLRQQISPHFFI
jgi:two-component system, LytTR family, sensor kinase